MLVPARAPADETVEEVVDFFNQFRNPLLRYVLALGLSMHDGEEVVQEVFLALFQHLRQGKPRTNLKGWVFRVAHNLALKQRTRNGRNGRLYCAENGAEQHFAPELNPEHPPPLSRPATLARSDGDEEPSPSGGRVGDGDSGDLALIVAKPRAFYRLCHRRIPACRS